MASKSHIKKMKRGHAAEGSGRIAQGLSAIDANPTWTDASSQRSDCSVTSPAGTAVLYKRCTTTVEDHGQ